MSTILLDISSLETLTYWDDQKTVSVYEEFIKNSTPQEKTWQLQHETALEAFIFYDNVLVDSRSIWNHFMWGDETFGFNGFENLCFLERLNKNEYDEINRQVSEELKLLSDLLDDDKKKWKANTHMVKRTLYYYYVQRYFDSKKKIKSHLLLDPLRVEQIRGITQEMKSDEMYASKIVDYFDKSIRLKKIERNQELVPNQEHYIKYPMVASYVFKKAKQQKGKTLAEIVFDIRESKKAKSFRQGYNFILENIDDRKLINKIIDDLEKIRKEWENDLSLNPTKKNFKINLSIPFVGGFELPLNIRLKNIQSKTNNILALIHEFINETT